MITSNVSSVLTPYVINYAMTQRFPVARSYAQEENDFKNLFSKPNQIFGPREKRSIRQTIV